MSPPADVTALLLAWNRGDEDARSALMTAVYAELRRMATRRLRSERSGHSLAATALVHETYLKLVNQTRVRWQNRAQFFALASHLMRRVLVDHARARQASKRGGGHGAVLVDDSSLLARTPAGTRVAAGRGHPRAGRGPRSLEGSRAPPQRAGGASILRRPFSGRNRRGLECLARDGDPRLGVRPRLAAPRAARHHPMSTANRWARVEAIFAGALERPVGERPTFLDEACNGDAALRGDIEGLLQSHDMAGTFLERPASPSGLDGHDEAAPPPLGAGTMLGAFEITAQLGAGGMATVYSARDTRLNRSVAIKVLTRGPNLEREAASDSSARRWPSRASHTRTSARCTDVGRAKVPDKRTS